jgi:tRNA (cytidine/uridine-2'-O-)-methyltransferase
MFQLALFEPQIAPNTGNIIRLAANTGAQLHLIEPLGFQMEDRQLKRAGLDYHEYARVTVHPDFASFLGAMAQRRVLAFSTKGTRSHADVAYLPDDVLLFGPETSGLPASILDGVPPDQVLRIPMRANVRSLNLSNAVAIACYEAWRQHDFA